MISKSKIYLDENDYKRFKHWLIDKGWTMNDFAKLIGVNPTKIHRYMTGKVSITPEVERLFLRLGYRLIPVKQGNRLTENWDNEHYHLDANLWIAAKEKLGHLEDAEEKLSIDLTILPKLLKIKSKDTVYVKEDDYIVKCKVMKNSLVDGDLIVFAEYIENHIVYTPICYYKDYGLIWALTKEELL